MKLAEVHTLYEQNASDIPAMLRQAADNIEKWRERSETNIKTMIAVTVDEDGDVQVYGWGQTDSMDCLATLQLAIVKRSIAMLGASDG